MNFLNNIFALKVGPMYVDLWNRTHFWYKFTISLETGRKQKVTFNVVLNPVLNPGLCGI